MKNFNHVLMTWISIITLTCAVIGGGVFIGSMHTEIKEVRIDLSDHLDDHDKRDEKVYNKLDDIHSGITTLAIEQARINGEVANELKNIANDINELKKTKR